MATLIRMSEYRGNTEFVHFERAEITQLLTLYAMRVASGEWRDYAIDVRPDGAMFSIFRHALERPLYTVTKSAAGSKGATWSVARSGRIVSRFPTLAGALAALDRAPRPVGS
ncbi:conserved protein of unknown function(Protein of unknown function DUF2794,17-97) [Magnetospirillum sp. XM-1]|uniref:DUF2794 domain-containing protein n=1 Tax=Magnetospirillum sp. XM-1 TaxID=1663591 RepID=UPI00073DC49F|nr:DUF2794 domain-containing protein [Magnetospirillum sp. XM-1]CUW39032.1 conserved protein of unknown function(Protein of unknown function DUF2794,17-97) [Magnetospirillum sp. XM-1]